MSEGPKELTEKNRAVYFDSQTGRGPIMIYERRCPHCGRFVRNDKTVIDVASPLYNPVVTNACCQKCKRVVMQLRWAEKKAKIEATGFWAGYQQVEIILAEGAI